MVGWRGEREGLPALLMIKRENTTMSARFDEGGTGYRFDSGLGATKVTDMKSRNMQFMPQAWTSFGWREWEHS